MKKLHIICWMICTWIICSFAQLEACSVGGRVASVTSSSSGRPGVAFVCFGSSATLNLTDHTGRVLRWEFSEDSTSWRPAPGSAASLTTPAITAPRWYRAVVKEGSCAEALSNPIKLDFEPPAVPGKLVSDKTTYECLDSFRVSVKGFKGRVVGYKFKRETDELIYKYSKTLFSVDSFCVLSARHYASFAVRARAMIINTCGDTVETPEIVLNVGKRMKPITNFRNNNDTICLHGGSINFYIDNFDISKYQFYHNVKYAGNLYYTYDLIDINTDVDYSTVGSTVYPEFYGYQGSLGLPYFITQTQSDEFTMNVDDWTNLMFESWLWDTSLMRFGKYPFVRIYLVDTTGCFSWDSIAIPIHYPSRAVGGVVETDRVICSGNSPGTLNLFGHEGRILRWESSTDAGRTWTTIALTGTSFTPPPLTTETWYRAIVDNNTCDGLKPSQPAKISIATSSVGGTITGDSEVCFSEDGTLLTLSNHKGQVKRWEISYDDGFNWAPIQHIAATYMLGPQTRSATYRAIVNAIGCTDVPSSGFKLNVLPEPAAVGGEIIAKWDTICAQECAELKLNFHVGDVVHWEKATNCQSRNWTIIGHAKESSINECGFFPANCCDVTPTSVCFRALLHTDDRCKTAYSTEQRITIDNRPCLSGATGVGGRCRCVCIRPLCGGEGTTIELSSHFGKVLYWEKAPTRDTTSWTTIANTTATLGTGPLTETTCFRAVVLRRGVLHRSKATCVEVNAASKGGTLTADRASVCRGEDSGPMQVANHVGDVDAWLYSDDGEITWKELPEGKAKEQMRSLKLTRSTAFKVRVRSCSSGDDYSNIVRIAVTPGIVSEGGYIAGNRSVCNEQTTTLRLTNSIGNIVRWEYSTSNWESIFHISSTSSTITTPAIATPTLFRAVVQSGACNTESSAEFRVSPGVSFAGTVSAKHKAICLPDGATDLELTNYVGNILNWESSTNNGATWIPLSSSSPRYTVTGINTTTQFRARAQNGSCGVVTTNAETISVLSSSFPGLLWGDQTVCSGNQRVYLFLSGSSADIEGWERSIDGGSTWAKVPYVTTNTLDEWFDFQVNTRYRVVTNTPGCGKLYSNEVNVTVRPGSIGGSIIGAGPVCGNSIKAELTLSGYDGNIVRWETRNRNDSVWTWIANTTEKQSVDIVAGKETVYYRAVVSKDGCTQVRSSMAALEFIPDSKVGMLSGSQVSCTGNLSLPLVYKDYKGIIRHWESSTDSIHWTTDSRRDSAWTPGPLTASTYYRVVSGNPACGLQTSNAVKVTVSPGASPGGIVASNTCSSDPVMITATGVSGRIFRWESSTDGGTTWRYFAGGTPILSVPSHTRATSYRYWVFCGGDTTTGSFSPAIHIQPSTDAASLGAFTANNTSVCPGSEVQFNLANHSGGPLSFEFSPDCFATPGTSTMVSSFPHSVNPTASGCYRLRVINPDCAPLVSPTVRVDVNASTTAPSVGVLSGEQTLCPGISGGILRLSGHSGTIAGWQSSSDCAGFTSPTDLGNAGNAELTLDVVPSTSCFRAVLSTACGLQYSPTARITVQPAMIVSAKYIDGGGCGGESRIEATAVGGSGNFSFYLDPGVVTDNRTGIFNPAHAGTYNVNAIDLATGCIANTTVTVTGSRSSSTITSVEPTQTTALVRWEAPVGPNITYNLRYRVLGSDPWNTRTTIPMTAVSLSGLQNGTRYETQVEVICPSGSTLGWSPRMEFLTQSDGNCMTNPIAKPGGTYIDNLRPRAATLKWNPVLGARGYIIQVWLKGASARTASSVAVCAPRDSFHLPGLVPGRSYMYRMQTSCLLCAAGARQGLSSWTSDFEFATPSLREGEEELAVVQSQELSIYPNPNNGSFQLQLASISDEPVHLKVYDLKGQLVAEHQWDSMSGEMQLPVELNNPASGIYLLQVSQGEFRWNAKLMID